MATYIHGLDRQSAPPSPAIARQMLDQIGGHWWNIYIGGPNFGGKGWSPAQVQDYVRHGIEHFMLTYVGRQAGGTLTHEKGVLDGKEALAIVKRYGYSGAVPICLDVEQGTLQSTPTALDYVRAWCSTVRAGGAVPGIYANPNTLIALHGKADVGFVWVASWISHGVVNADPHSAHGMPANLWPGHGQRAWQHSGETVVPGFTFNVDINVADIDCLAHAPGVHATQAPSRAHALRRGARGPRVRQLTRRLSYVHSHATGKVYLDGERAVFDAQTDASLKAFQREHHIKPKGVFGVATQHALGRSVELEKARRRKVREGFTTQHPAPTNGSGGNGAHRAPLSFASLVADVRRLDAETDRAWRLLVAYEAKRRKALEEARDEAVSLADIARILIKMEHTLETLVDVEKQEVEELSAPPPPASPPAAPTGTPTVTEAATVLVTPAPPSPPQPAPEPAPVPAHPVLKLEDLADPELLHRVDRYDHAVGASREVLIARYAEVERKIARLTGSHPSRPRPSPAGGGGATPGAPRPPKRPDQPAGKVPAKVGVRKLQLALNRFTQRYLHGTAPIAVDGKRGPDTNHRIRDVKFYLGYAKGKNSAAVDRALLRRLRRPGSPRFSNPAMIARARARRHKQKKLSTQSLAQSNGTVMIDGYRVAGWIAVQVLWARDNGWHGKVISGYRTPEYSEHVCMRMYHRPSVPGKCAGRNSNHVGLVAPSGAVDVSMPEQFAAAMRRSPHSPSLCNALPSTDPRHFSHTGH